MILRPNYLDWELGEPLRKPQNRVVLRGDANKDVCLLFDDFSRFGFRDISGRVNVQVSANHTDAWKQWQNHPEGLRNTYGGQYTEGECLRWTGMPNAFGGSGSQTEYGDVAPIAFGVVFQLIGTTPANPLYLLVGDRSSTDAAGHVISPQWALCYRGDTTLGVNAGDQASIDFTVPDLRDGKTHCAIAVAWATSTTQYARLILDGEIYSEQTRTDSRCDCRDGWGAFCGIGAHHNRLLEGVCKLAWVSLQADSFEHYRKESIDPFKILAPGNDAVFLYSVPATGIAGQTLHPSGVTSAETFGALEASPGTVDILANGIASAEDHGSAVIDTGVIIVAPSAIATEESHGGASLQPGAVTLDPIGINSAENCGTALLSLGAVQILANGIASAEAHGSASFSIGTVTIDPAGIISAEAFGSSAVLNGAVLIAAPGIDSAEAFGVLTFQPGAVTVEPAGVGSTEAFGSSAVLNGAVLIAASGIDSAEAFGVLTFQPGAVTVDAAGIDTGEAFGSHELALGAILVVPPGIVSGELFGDSLIIPQVKIIEPAGIVSAELFGTLTLIGGAELIGWLIAQIQSRPALISEPKTPPRAGADIRINWDA